MTYGEYALTGTASQVTLMKKQTYSIEHQKLFYI